MTRPATPRSPLGLTTAPPAPTGARAGPICTPPGPTAARAHLHRLARPLLNVFDRERLRLLPRLRPPGARVIDAGAGQGRFVARAREAGYNTWGCDPHPRGTGVERGTLETIEVPAGRADAVTLWHALEHVDDPGAALRARSRLAGPGQRGDRRHPQSRQLAGSRGGACWFTSTCPATAHTLHPGGIAFEALAGARRHGGTIVVLAHRGG